jgi:hypothetical protein
MAVNKADYVTNGVGPTLATAYGLAVLAERVATLEAALAEALSAKAKRPTAKP